jgi:hypothetical protein
MRRAVILGAIMNDILISNTKKYAHYRAIIVVKETKVRIPASICTMYNTYIKFTL